jgi:hypothetical protein
MASMSSSELLAVATVLLANGRTSACPSHPTDGAESGMTAPLSGGLGEEVGRREASGSAGQRVGTGGGRGGGRGRKGGAAQATWAN